MTPEPIHSFFDMPLSEWISAIPNEFDTDAVGLWEIIPGLQKSFGLSDAELELAIREILAGLLARGARPVFGCSPQEGFWKEATRYGDNPAAIVDAIIEEWHRMGRDPDVGDVWFALPRLFRKP
jgi:hypothetical protein